MSERDVYIPEEVGDELTSDYLMRELWRVSDSLHGDDEWTYPSLENSWVAVATVRYKKLNNGLVILEGRVNTGTVGNRVFQLPINYRPGQNLRIPMDSLGAYGYFDILSTGDVTPQLAPGTGSWSSLVATFYAEE